MNFKVKCTGVHEGNPRFTNGKIYEVRNGKLFADKSVRYEAWAKPINGNGDFEALRKWFKDYYEFELVEEHKTKYKVGDKVRVRSDLTSSCRLYKMQTGSHDGWCTVGSMAALAGKVVTITEYDMKNYSYHIAETYRLHWTDEMFEGLAEENKTSKFKFKVGDRVIPNQYIGEGHIGTVICIKEGACSYGIEFDKPGIGMHNCGCFDLVAGKRGTRNNSLWHNEEWLDLATENKPENDMENKKVEDNKIDVNKMMNGKVRCVGYKQSEKNFTIGKVYEVKDGRITCDNGFRYSPINGKTAVKWLNPWYTFEAVIEEKEIVITHDGKTTTATMYCADGTKKVATARCTPEDKFDFEFGAKLAMDRLMESIENSKYTVVEIKYHNTRRTYHYKTKDSTAKVGMKIMVPVGGNNREIEAAITNVIPGSAYIGTFPISDMKEIEIKEVQLYNGKVVCIDSGSCSATLTVGKIYNIVDGIGYADNGANFTNHPVKSVYDLNSRFSTVKFLEIVE